MIFFFIYLSCMNVCKLELKISKVFTSKSSKYSNSCLPQHVRSVFLTYWACFNQLSLMAITGRNQGAWAHQDQVETFQLTEAHGFKNLLAKLFDRARKDLVEEPSGSIR